MDFARHNRLLKIIVGSRYGENPLEHLPEIRAEKIAQTEQMLKSFPIHSSDRVMDLGCGCGWAAHAIAPLSASYVGVDVEEDFIKLAEAEFTARPGLDFHVIEHGDLSHFQDQKISKVFASDVVTQFNLYDLAAYLKAVREILEKDGLFYFNFLNADLLHHRQNPKFARHLAAYQKDRSQFSHLMQWHSARTISAFAVNSGFRIEHLIENEFSWVVLKA